MAASTTLLTEDELGPILSLLPEWTRSSAGTSLSRTIEFADFAAAFSFLAAVALHAQRVNHHPDFSQSWATITFTLCTHAVGGLTTGDTDLATVIDRLIDAHGGDEPAEAAH
ncbi:MAG: 4a-hydroxytetrahydrobiopterin dehydratase [Solirubrobacteraceae bacterium]|nr:4a-hydroxytetrahydrobiopterin dehydratase [Solirubrobacteraceae bacterium]